MLAVHSWHYAQSKLPSTWCAHLRFLRCIAILFRKKMAKNRTRKTVEKKILIDPGKRKKKSSQPRKSQKRKYSLSVNVHDRLDHIQQTHGVCV